MRDNDHRAGQLIQKIGHARPDGGAILALRAVELPQAAGTGVAGLFADLVAGQTFPQATVDFPQPRIQSDIVAVTKDQTCGLSGGSRRMLVNRLHSRG